MKGNKSRSNTSRVLSVWYNFRFKIIFEGIIVGILSGLIVVFYRFMLEKSGIITKEVYNMLKNNHLLIPIWFLILIFLSYIVGIMVKKQPMISGSGIPQVKGVLLGHLKMNWWKVIVGKFVGGILAIGAGLSLGREGPSIQLGASVGLGVSKLLKRMKMEERFLMTSGASAGLAAAFNAPLAGVIFSLEEIHKSFSPLVLLSAMSSALTADFVSKIFFGMNPVFNFQDLSPLHLSKYGYIFVLGIVLGIFGVLFNKVIIKILNIYGKQRWLPPELRPVIPFLIAGILGFVLPQVLGGGNELIISLVKNNFTLKALIILLIAKFLFTMISFGSGVPGGIFLPLLVIGALIGNLYGSIASSIFHLNPEYINNFIILSMAGYFTATVRAPITGAILITEMTGSFNHLLSLTLVSIVAYVVADAMGSSPVYDALLERLLNNKEDRNPEEDKNTKQILEIPVCIGSAIEGKRIMDIKWPGNCLIAGIKRGDKEVIPKGNTKIYPGDYLIILVNAYEAPEIGEKLSELAADFYN